MKSESFLESGLVAHSNIDEASLKSEQEDESLRCHLKEDSEGELSDMALLQKECLGLREQLREQQEAFRELDSQTRVVSAGLG